MRPHRLRQWLHRRLNPTADMPDSLEAIPHRVEADEQANIDLACRYFSEELPEVVFPAKSFSVAILYAHWLEQEFGEDFFECLSDPELFLGTDRYFVPYRAASRVYDTILERIGRNSGRFRPDTSLSQVAATRHFFEQEFLE